MRLGTSGQDVARKLFSDWSTVKTYWDDLDDVFHVKLTLSSQQMEAIRGDWGKLAVPASKVLPKYRQRVRRGPRRGLRGPY